jgi:8-amino-3,8-dideoxy-alpha-D-manno-octulosonate transaminase
MPGFEVFGDEERKHVNQVLDTGILARYGFEDVRSSKATELEQAICAAFGCTYAHLVSSGSTALITALAASGIGAGHEVIFPVFGDVACFEAIVTLGAIPVPADIDGSLALDPAAVEAAITSKTRAVLLVHSAGMAADVAAIKAVCDSHGLILIEDASQAIGAVRDSKAAGTTGQAGIISFDFLNTITCGEGGAIVTNDPLIYQLCSQYSDHGHDHLGDRRRVDSHRYMGAGFRISELHAAVGLAQLVRLPQILEQQTVLCAALKRELVGIPQLRFREDIPGADNSGYLTFFLKGERQTQELCEAMSREGLPYQYWYDSRWHYIRRWEHFKNGSWMNRLYNDQKMNILHYSNHEFPMSDRIVNRCISVAVSLRWTTEEAATKGRLIAELVQQLSEENINQKDIA